MIKSFESPLNPRGAAQGMLAAEVAAVLRARPGLTLVKVADGAADNWDFLASDALPASEEVVDFFHASEHLHAAVAAVYGDGTRETQYRYETLRETLRDQQRGVDKVIRALKHLATKHGRKTAVTRSLAYCTPCTDSVIDEAWGVAQARCRGRSVSA